ncbi:MAG: TM2 domain-containing protein [Clostridia bacterium]|nr:TM2 domain-containing protein [Clostridia bacterium]
MEELKKLRETLDTLPWIAVLLLVIFADGIYGGLYRITKGDTTGIVIGILWIVTGGLFGIGWIIDLVTVIVNKKITFLA